MLRIALARMVLGLLTSCLMVGAGQTLAAAQSTDALYQAKPNEAVIFYKRADANYAGWGLHLWDGDGRTRGLNELVSATAWDAPLAPSGVHPDFGAYFIVPMTGPDWADFMFIVHKGSAKDIGGLDHLFDRAQLGSQTLFTFAGSAKLFTEPSLVPPIAIEGAAAHWLDTDTLVFNPGVVPSVRLYYSADADIHSDALAKQMLGGAAVELTRSELSADLQARFPHLADFKAWTVPAQVDVGDLLKGQLVVATFEPDGSLAAATQVQTAGVLDALYADAAADVKLGAQISDRETHFRLWAPTAQAVTLQLYKNIDKKSKSEKMAFDTQTGIWSVVLKGNQQGRYYRYELQVYHPDTAAIEHYEVTDPYSLSLSTNSQFSQVVDLNDPSLIPAHWGEGDPSLMPVKNNAVGHVAENNVAENNVAVNNVAVEQGGAENIVIYEAHVRDLTLSDTQGRAELNGKYAAFGEDERASMQHLKALQQAGLTHLQLLPTFDLATVNEAADQRLNIDQPMSRLCRLNPAIQTTRYADYCAGSQTIRALLSSFPADSDQQQDLMRYVRPLDSFNWGYDPFHYSVPEGSYASDPEGQARILEYRQMIQSIHDMGLKVVMDVVYNHTNAAGIADKSVLDRVVPGYYHRRNPSSGAVENSTCCQNTATEQRMMAKLMIDSLVVWARDYQIDAFRFDLMGHHMKSNLEQALAAVQRVRPHVYFYGEGWNFGEVANGARGENAVQWAMAGTGIGTFSDRLRDAVRGGGPFDEGEALRVNQGFANGLYYLPNALRQDAAHDRADLLHKADLIRVGLAGNLRDFVLIKSDGFPAMGQDIDYNGQAAGYTLDPQENISYVSKHDNQTLWDNNQYRIADYVSTSERVRMQNLGLAINLMVQGVPFFHMGSDLLRSKSMQRDSYDSGDWFNSVDFSAQESGWARGLPRQDKDGGNWGLVREAFANQQTYSDRADRQLAAAVFQEFLTIRQSSPLFHLATADAVHQRLDFHNVGVAQIPGLIGMSINDGKGLRDLDPELDAIMVLINAADVSMALRVPGAQGFVLHPSQQQSIDPAIRHAAFVDGEFRVPALSVAVFVLAQQGAQGPGLPVAVKDLSQRAPLGRTPLYLRGTVTSWETLSSANQFQFQGQGRYAIELNLTKGFYKVKVGNDADLEFGKLGAFLEIDTPVDLTSPGGVMNLQLGESGRYRFEMNFNDPTRPRMAIHKVN
ncbi:pullulanase-type alpha-1,6-glucosidase [Reinekea sp.]|uniref:pullulanase-type alpha-1,6-glucosidase n=1 Tax=Reinekea sp. TaxID=1970455 RepID=UPI002A7FEBE5|nr:pullulanase-type alpha-1,6-glucosidase [Reinekea sp.]